MGSISVTVRIRQRPVEKNQDLATLEVRDVSGEGESYERARDAAQAQIPEGWQAIGISRW